MSKWTEEVTGQLTSAAGDQLVEVSKAVVAEIAESLGDEFSERSVASKLRNLGYSVEKASASREKAYSDVEADEIQAFLEANSGVYTYAEVASTVLGGTRTSKQIQGKILSMELHSHVKHVEVVEAPKKYTEEEEESIIGLIESGAFIEDIAGALGREVNSIRGKCLSLNRQKGLPIPKMKNVKDKSAQVADIFDGIEDIDLKTVEELSDLTGKTPRSIKSALTKRGLVAENYDGAKRRAKLDSKCDLEEA